MSRGLAVSPRVLMLRFSSIDEKSTEKEESQKLQARMLEGSTAPQCKQVFVTGRFCAADASTPVRREPDQANMRWKDPSGKNLRGAKKAAVPG